MRRYLHYICFLFVLCSCESQIEYKGAYTDPVLVLHSNVYTYASTLLAYPSRSYFFLDDWQFTSDYKLEDAFVEYKLNTDEWKALSNATYPLSASSAREFRAGDSIRMRASHKDYESVLSEVEIFPEQPQFSIKDMVQDTDWVVVTLEIEPYRGTNDVVIALGGQAYFDYISQTITWHTRLTEDGEEVIYDYEEWGSDTSEVASALMYSRSPIFASYDNRLIQSSGHYSSSVYLYFSPGMVTKPTVLDIKFRQYSSMYANTTSSRSMSRCRSVSILLEAMTLDTYRYHYSTTRHLKFDPMSNLDKDDFMSSMFDLSDIGLQEEVQVYSNIRGGMGCLCVSSINEQSAEFSPADCWYPQF